MEQKAEESDRIKRARDKLEKQLTEERKLFNPEKLNKTMQQIYRWIERNSSERVNLKDKNISLFDEGEHKVRTHSKFVKELREKLLNPALPQAEEREKDQAGPPAPPEESPLKGRVNQSEE